MTHTFLLEIGIEDMPQNVIVSAETQLLEKTTDFLNEVHLKFSDVTSFSTPRRFAILVEGLSDKQPDETLIVRGPAQRIAQDEDGNWTKAAIGFSKGQGGTVEDLVIKEVKGEPYVFIEKFVPGKNAYELLQDLNEVVKSIEFPKNMKWGNTSYQYVRPIHWMVALLDDEVVPFEVFDVSTGCTTFGHRFLGKQIEIDKPSTYEAQLKEQFVIANRNDRKNMIIKQIEDLCHENNWQVPADYPELLDEVTDLVEYPTAFYGKFAEEYLDVPSIVLETSMIDHQRYFPVRANTEEGKLLPFFISVRNGTADYIENVAKGNEKVLSARLADAKFFYEEDQKVAVADFAEKLKQVDYHEKLGSLYEKQVRAVNMADVIAGFYELTEQELVDLKRAASIYKFDLVTQMVNEFTSLQGTIGEIYALEQGESPAVAAAIGEQYKPTSATDELPETVLGKYLALIDKVDSILQFFSVDLIPTGSNDPYALRRQAIGVVRLIFNLENYQVDLNEFIQRMIEKSNFTGDQLDTITDYKEKVIRFILDRLDQIMQSEFKLAHDIRQAALGSTQTNIIRIFQTANVLQEEKANEDFKAVVESITRVFNITKKQGNVGEVDEALIETESERDLLAAVRVLADTFHDSADANIRYQALKALSPIIDEFFEHNMIMVDDEAIKQNRLTLLHNLSSIARQYADFSLLVI